MRLPTALSLAALAVTAAGCGNDTPTPPKKVPIELKDVPPEIMKIAKEKLPDVTWVDAFKKSNGMIEVRGKEKNGKIREIGVMPDLTVAEME